MSRNTVLSIVFSLLFVLSLVAVPQTAYSAPIEDEKPEIVIKGDVIAGEPVEIIVHTPYIYWELYFATTGTILESPSDCTINVVGGANCQPGNEHLFKVEVPISESHLMWVYAESTFASRVEQTELYVETSVDDIFQVRPGEKSEYLAFLANDSLGEWNSVGIYPSDVPFSYTHPSPGMLQVLYPENGLYRFGYWVRDEDGEKYGTIIVNVSPYAPASRFPNLVDDHVELTEGQTSEWIGFLSNDKIAPSENGRSIGIIPASLPFTYTSPSPGALQVFAPTSGTYSLTYYVDIWGIGRDEAQIILHINQKVVPEPTPIDPVDQPKLEHHVWLPKMEVAS